MGTIGKITLVVIVILTGNLLFGCASIEPNCVPKALYQGGTWMYQKEKRVRFVHGRTDIPFLSHVQVQFYDEEKNQWVWSQQGANAVFPGGKDKFYPERYMTFREFVDFLYKTGHFKEEETKIARPTSLQ